MVSTKFLLWQKGERERERETELEEKTKIASSYTTLAKKIETATQAKHRRVHAREITRLRHLVLIFLARVLVLALVHKRRGMDWVLGVLV